ncbi:DUF4145 domain-containing protein [Vibrio campbellii]|uniref:DUF4145 domain-containing protein n=1 Tax=Vibrio campbellii TaxID=680 RepID=UPI003857DEEC
MSQLVSNCPRCKAKEITFDVVSHNYYEYRDGWQRRYEAFCICRSCSRSTVFFLDQNSTREAEIALKNNNLENITRAINPYVFIKGYVSLKDTAAETPPAHLPSDIDSIFREGAACMAIGCFNAAATMFRLCLDKATLSLLPDDEEKGPSNKIRRSLGLRLGWLYQSGYLPRSLEDLSTCIKDDGNDGAHEGTLSEHDAEDILDFTFVLLERIYTEPKRIELAKERRLNRREKAQAS